MIPIILIIEIIITDFEKASEEGNLWIIPTLSPVLILLIIFFLLDWAYYQDIVKVSIGLGFFFILMVISYFLFNIIVNCSENKEYRSYIHVTKDKIKFLSS